MTDPEVILRRYREADEQARAGPSLNEGVPGPIEQVFRFGVAQIDSNDGSGAYTITEQRWDPGAAPPAWIDGVKPARWVAKSARDFQERDSGVADDYVLFWEQRDDTGALEILIDVGIPTGTEGQVLVAGADGTPEWETPAVCT